MVAVGSVSTTACPAWSYVVVRGPPCHSGDAIESSSRGNRHVVDAPVTIFSIATTVQRVHDVQRWTLNLCPLYLLCFHSRTRKKAPWEVLTAGNCFFVYCLTRPSWSMCNLSLVQTDCYRGSLLFQSDVAQPAFRSHQLHCPSPLTRSMNVAANESRHRSATLAQAFSSQRIFESLLQRLDTELWTTRIIHYGRPRGGLQPTSASRPICT